MSNRENPRRPPSSSPRPPPKAPPSSNPPLNSPPAKTPLSARAAARRPGAGNRSSIYGTERMAEVDEDARAQSAALVQDLKQQLEKTMEASDSYKKQADILQLKLDEITNEHTMLEEQTHDHDSKVLALQDELMDLRKHRRETEKGFDAERAQMMQERERQAHREEELQSVISRLNETIRQKEMRNQLDGDRPGMSRSSSFRNRASPGLDAEQFSPSATTLERSPSRNNSKLLLQKDKMIESLRLELAEAQIKLAEMEHMGDGRLQELEKTLLETRMANARLMEDNESFQLLLSQKTLKGDFMADSRAEAPAPEMGSLADELEAPSPTDLADGESEAYRKLEAEAKSLRDGNKALTLYIDKIIGRLLQHEGFEHIIHDRDEGDVPPPPPKRAATEKALPPAPGKDIGPSLLQRARSVVGGPRQQPQQAKARPMSYMAPPREVTEPSANENPDTAPSIPLGRTTSVRGHRRTRSDQAEPDGAAVAAVVGQMYKGPPKPVRTTSGGPMSPRMSPSLSANRPTVFGNPSTSRSVSATGSATASTTGTGAGAVSGATGGSSSNSIISDHSGDMNSNGTSSPPRSNMNNFAGAVMKQNQLRPLRLVKESEDEAAKKKANRSSWMGWFNRGVEENAKPGG